MKRITKREYDSIKVNHPNMVVRVKYGYYKVEQLLKSLLTIQ